MKEGWKRELYANDKKVKTAVMKWLKELSTEFYEVGIHALIRRWGIATERKVDYVKK